MQKRNQATKVHAILTQQQNDNAATKSTQKRPTLRSKRPLSSSTTTTTAEAALAAARSRLDDNNNNNEKEAKPKPTKPASSSSSDALIQRRKATAPLLGTLVSASISTSSSVEPHTAGNYGHVEPEDYWRNLRDWDFVTHYCREVSGQRGNHNNNNNNKKDKKDNDNDNDDDDKNKNNNKKENAPKKKPLPNTFISHRHYIASWAPLCLAESRAQLLSECLSSLRRITFVTVVVQTAKKNLGSTLDSLLLQCRPKLTAARHENISFLPGDSCILVPLDKVDEVQHFMRTGLVKDAVADKSFRSCSLLGHTEHARRSVDGLQLKVSKRWWAKVHSEGNEQYGLLKLGNNVTSVREFAALCRIDVLPLKTHLLGQHLKEEEEGADKRNEYKAKRITKAQLLMKMGGVTALGQGFTKYAQKKFNPSQMQAISAAAHEYGEGGFTLIKGPPGTGKVREKETLRTCV